MLWQVRVRSFAKPTAGVQPRLIKVEPQTRPGNDGRRDQLVPVPLMRLVHAQTSIPERVRLPLEFTPRGQPRRENSENRPIRDFVADLQDIRITSWRRPEGSLPPDAAPMIRRASELREVHPHVLILLHRGQESLAYIASHRREKRSEEFELRRCRVP